MVNFLSRQAHGLQLKCRWHLYSKNKTFRAYLETIIKTFNWINFNQNLPSRELFVCLFTIWCQLEQAKAGLMTALCSADGT